MEKQIELSVVDLMAIDGLLSLLNAHLELGDEFKKMIDRYHEALHKAGLLEFHGELYYDDFDCLGFGS